MTGKEQLAALAARLMQNDHNVLDTLEAIERLGTAAATPEILEALSQAIASAGQTAKRLQARMEEAENSPYPYYMTESGRESYGRWRTGAAYCEHVQSRAKALLARLSKEAQRRDAQK